MSAPGSTGQDQLRGQLFAWADEASDHVYANPAGVVVVPMGSTSVFVDSEQTRDGRVCVSIRAVVLQDMPRRPQLYEYVALSAGRYLVGGLYLYPEGDTLDLDTIARAWGDALGRDEFLQLVATIGRNALELADHLEPRFGGHRLNPSGEVIPKLWGAAAMSGRRDVADALVAALDTQSTAIMGCPLHATFMAPLRNFRGELESPVYAVTSGGIWVAGREQSGRAPVIWRVEHREIEKDVMHHERVPYDYYALLKDSSALEIQVSTPEEAYAILLARNEAG